MNPFTTVVGMGSIIRNEKSETVMANMDGAKVSTSVETEMNALYKGLKLCRDLHIHWIQIEGDCHILVTSLQNSINLSWDLMAS